MRIIVGDALESLRTLPTESVQMCVTSPPYFGLRDYGTPGQMGLEPTPELYVERMVAVFREVGRVLRDDGVLFLNIGDSYASNVKGSGGAGRSRLGPNRDLQNIGFQKMTPRKFNHGCKQKDLIGIPWALAFALRADGWYLRSDIIWAKPNPMPESVTDRPTKSHEYLFLLSKSARYFYDADAIAEPLADSSIERLSQPTLELQHGSDRVPGKTNGTMRAVGNVYTARAFGDTPQSAPRGPRSNFGQGGMGTRNSRSVWTVATQGFKGAHFATFPPKLIEPCILAGSRSGDTVLDPFGGAGTTGLVASRLDRNAILIELNPEYAAMAERRIYADSPLFNTAAR